MKSLITALGLTVVASCAQPNQQAKVQSAEPESEAFVQQAGQKVDPAVITALNRMSDYLGTLKTIEVNAKTSIDEVLIDTGQKVQFAGEGLYKIRRPNAFFVETKTDRRHRQFYFDGKTFTIYSPRLKVYAQRPAPATIPEMVDQMETRYGIQVPLADLFHWGSDRETPADFEYASRIGYARIAGQDCDQYAMRQGSLDWQVWIARGDRPLPLKVVITSYEEVGQPQFTSELGWKVNPRFDEKVFAFRSPKDTHPIQLAAN